MGDLVASSATDCGYTTDVIYTICGKDDDDTDTIQLDETLGCGGYL